MDKSNARPQLHFLEFQIVITLTKDYWATEALENIPLPITWGLLSLFPFFCNDDRFCFVTLALLVCHLLYLPFTFKPLSITVFLSDSVFVFVLDFDSVFVSVLVSVLVSVFFVFFYAIFIWFSSPFCSVSKFPATKLPFSLSFCLCLCLSFRLSLWSLFSFFCDDDQSCFMTDMTLKVSFYFFSFSCPLLYSAATFIFKPFSLCLFAFVFRCVLASL